MKSELISEITVRNLLMPGDLGYIAAMHGELYARECNYGLSFESYVLAGLAEFARQYDSEKDRIWVCEYQGRVIGSLVAQHREDVVQLRYFIFLPEYRGAGLGKQLMNAFLSFMEEKGYRQAYLWTTDEQQSAVALYERCGFVLAEEKESGVFGKILTERKYELSLNSGR